MRFKQTAGLLTAMVLATGALNIGCGSESDKPHEGRSATEAQHASEVTVTGAGGSTTSVGAGVGTGGGTGAGSGRTSFDGTVDATSDAGNATTKATGDAAKPAAESGHGAEHGEKNGEHK